MQTEMLAIADIRCDGGTQMRATQDTDHVTMMADHLRAGGAITDPIEVVYDGTNYWLVDGFHRRAAYQLAGIPNIAAIVRPGTQREAKWFAYAANQKHTGLRRTRADITRSIEDALREFPEKSDREIARQIGGTCAHTTVGRHRAELSTTGAMHQSSEREGADGRTINVSNIGKRDTKPANTPTTAATIDRVPEPEASDDDFNLDADPGEEVVADGITPPPPIPPERPAGDFGELDDGLAFTRLSNACRAFETTITALLDERSLKAYRGAYRNGAETELLRIVKLLSERVKAIHERPAFGVINGGR